jgi:hypothetical protein
MYDVYLNVRNDLLVVPTGYSIPIELGGSWRRKKRAVRLVSETIRKDVQSSGFHRRRLIAHRSKTIAKGAD